MATRWPRAGAPARRVIDAGGHIVAPGFIDIHSHSDEAMFVSSALESAVHQGVTTVVCGNCGGASAPVLGLAASELERDLSSVLGVDVRVKCVRQPPREAPPATEDPMLRAALETFRRPERILEVE